MLPFTAGGERGQRSGVAQGLLGKSNLGSEVTFWAQLIARFFLVIVQGSI